MSMQQESLSLPPVSDRAASALEKALAQVVARVRDQFDAERRAMHAELQLSRAELSRALDEAKQSRIDFERWFAAVQQARVELQGIQGRDGAPGPAGERGPQGERGEPGAPGERGLDGAPGATGAPGAAGERGPPGEPGVDGPQGRDGRDGLPGVQGERGKDGRDGLDGKDGLGFDDARQFVGEGVFGIEFLRAGEVVQKFTWPTPTLADSHCGPYRAGKSYKRGQCATYGGSTFLCLRETDQKPETEDWCLIVKHGLPGRSGKDGERGAPGPAGRDGRDLTQMTPGGYKYG
jgi:collagen triple helix repeat protein